MRAGTLRDLVRVERQVVTIDEAGAPAKGWELVRTVHASIATISGREYFGAGQEASEGSVKITLRRLPGLAFDPSWRIVDARRGTIFDVLAVLPTRLQNDLTLAARHGGVKRS